MSVARDTTLDKVTAANLFANALDDASRLLPANCSEGQQKHPDFKSVLEFRLSQYYSFLDKELPSASLQSLQDVELLTACEALSIVERVQTLLAIEDDTVAPAVGTRDLAQIRMLLSLIFTWGTLPILAQVIKAWSPESPRRDSLRTPSQIVEAPNEVKNYDLLSALIHRSIGLIFPEGVHGKMPQSLVTTTLLSRHLMDILQPSLALGWLPKSLSTKEMPTKHEIRPLIMRLLHILPASQVISSLGQIMSISPPPPAHAFRACTTLLSRQLLRSDGVQGLFAAMFGEEEDFGGGSALEKLDRVSLVLNAVPANTKPQDYFHHIVSRLVVLLSDKSPPSYRRAASFTISRMLSTDGTSVSDSIKEKIILDLLHDPLLHMQDEVEGHDLEQLERAPQGTKTTLRPDVVINLFLTLLSNADPSPVFVSRLLSPVVPALYSLLNHLHSIKTSDPKLKESVRGMLLTWGKIAIASEGLETLCYIVRGDRQSGWRIDIEGHIWHLSELEKPSSLSLLTPQQVPQSLDLEHPDFDANVFDLYPDPLHFVKFIKDMDRGDIAADLFVRLLEFYREEKSRFDNDSLRALLYVQLILQMQKHLSEGTTSNILKRPQQMLLFIHHVLESTNTSISMEPPPERPGLEQTLRFVPIKNEASEEGDSDDDMPDSEVLRPDDELVETAVNLLLSVLEADEDLSARTMPILNEIFMLLEGLLNSMSSTVQPLARQARLVMTARLASTSRAGQTRTTNSGETVQDIYQKALKLLQDPILPVRAHGLLLLRQLCGSPEPRANTQGLLTLDPTLAPAILSIFLQAAHDDDSYIFLNAVQGLAAMFDSQGKEVLKGLMNEYAGGLDGLGASVVTQRDVDVRTRIGEALAVVIKRCGSALGIYVDILVPPLFKLVRTPVIPTTLRTSALSLLADCVNTYSFAGLGYMEELAAAMVDLVQVESVPALQQVRKMKENLEAEEDRNPKKEDVGMKFDPVDDSVKAKAENTTEHPQTMDTSPTSTNPKFPPLRRAALHFLGLLIKEAVRHSYESPLQKNILISGTLVSRATIILGYIASMDEDDIVRVMAREVKQGLDDLRKARLGL